jgi:hypothetical protein
MKLCMILAVGLILSGCAEALVAAPTDAKFGRACTNDGELALYQMHTKQGDYTRFRATEENCPERQ